jgi:hypothetical protein
LLLELIRNGEGRAIASASDHDGGVDEQFADLLRSVGYPFVVIEIGE